MDFGLSHEQQHLMEAVTLLLQRHAGASRAREITAEGGLDRDLVNALSSAGYLDVMEDGTGPLEGVLITEAVAEAAGCAPVGARLLVAPAVLDRPIPAVIALADMKGTALARYGTCADMALLLDSHGASVIRNLHHANPVASTCGYPLGDLSHCEVSEHMGAPAAGGLRSWWSVALAAELVGTMQGALNATTSYLSQRHQFGRPLTSFQALRHRLAELHIGIDGARWLTRYAGWAKGDAELAAEAASQASAAAEAVLMETHQLSGAIGLTCEYDLHLWTSRLQALRLELGGKAGHARAVARARWLEPEALTASNETRATTAARRAGAPT